MPLAQDLRPLGRQVARHFHAGCGCQRETGAPPQASDPQKKDPRRLAVFGGSFGGSATLSAVTRLPQYWACGVDICGPANLVTFTRTVPPHWRSLVKAWVGAPDEDRDFLLSRSPITYVDNECCPLLVIQGANDPRVVKAESDQMVERLRTRGVPVEYLVFDDEGHGFAKRHNQIRRFQVVVAFLERHLLPE